MSSVTEGFARFAKICTILGGANQGGGKHFVQNHPNRLKSYNARAKVSIEIC